jgi:hypothetical protein
VLAAVWLRRLAMVAPAARPWETAACALLMARVLLVEHASPSPHLLLVVRPLLGRGWETARSVAGLRNALAPSDRTVFDGVERPEELWRAEARLAARMEADGFGLLRASRPGPAVVLGALAVLCIDAWRVRAAMAAAAAGTGTSEVLDVVA